MSTITSEQYGQICDAIDRVKSDDRPLDTDEYAGMILDALGLSIWTDPEPFERDGHRLTREQYLAIPPAERKASVMFSPRRTPPLTFHTSTSRAATSEEVSSLLYGTGALSWEWWGSCDSEERDGVTGYLLHHATEDSPDDGSTPGRTWLSEQQILNAAARAIEMGYGDEDRHDIIGESVGYFDASAGDVVLQLAVFGKVVFG